LLFIILGISAVGFWGALNLSIEEWQEAGACPCIGIPACYLVAIGYFLILSSCINHNKALFRKLFYAGISIVLGLAAMGSFMQVTGLGECPQNKTGFPMCYISLMMSTTILVAFFVGRRKAMRLAK
jgi:hypothetical protein